VPRLAQCQFIAFSLPNSGWDIQRNLKTYAMPTPSCLCGILTFGENTAHPEKHQPKKPDCPKKPMIIADLFSATI
jgi:hypothetical protein